MEKYFNENHQSNKNLELWKTDVKHEKKWRWLKEWQNFRTRF
jgi:hypothetical protein